MLLSCLLFIFLAFVEINISFACHALIETIQTINDADNVIHFEEYIYDWNDSGMSHDRKIS